MDLSELINKFSKRDYNFRNTDYTQSMNPIGLTKSIYNKSMFKRPGEQIENENKVISNPKDQFLNYISSNKNEIFTGAFESVDQLNKIFKSSTLISDTPLKLNPDLEDVDNKAVISRQQVLDKWNLNFDTHINIQNAGFTRDQKFEGVSDIRGGSSASYTNSVNIRHDGNNNREYNIELEKDGFVDYLKNSAIKNLEKLKGGNTASFNRISDQKKICDDSVPDSYTDAYMARHSSKPYENGDAGSFPVG